MSSNSPSTVPEPKDKAPIVPSLFAKQAHLEVQHVTDSSCDLDDNQSDEAPTGRARVDSKIRVKNEKLKIKSNIPPIDNQRHKHVYSSFGKMNTAQQLTQ